MVARLVWLALATGLAILYAPRPGAGRIFAEVFFWLTAPGVNARLAFPNQQALVDFVDGRQLGFSRDGFAPVVAWKRRPIALAAAGFAPVVGGVILGRGRAVTVGLVGATIFLLGVTPLGTEEPPSPVLAAGLGLLLGKLLDRTGREVLRAVIGNRRRRLLA